MPVSFVDVATSTSDTPVVIPATVQAGDLMIAKGFDNSATPPALPAGWNSIGTAFRTGASQALCWKVYAPGDVGPTWVGVTSNSMLFYRGQHASPIGGVSTPASGSGSVLTIPAVTLSVSDGTSWIAAMYGHRNAGGFDTPSAMVERMDVPDGVIRQGGSDSNGGVASWASRTFNYVPGSNAAWVALAFEIKAAAAGPPPEDSSKFFQFL